MVKTSLRGRAGRGAAAGLVGGLIEQLASVVATTITAHILSPGEFGVVAVAGIVVALLSVMTSLGLNISLIRAESLSEQEISSVFWLSIGLAVASCSIVTALAFPLTVLIGDGQAAPYLQGLALAFLIRSLQLVPRALLLRAARYERVYLTQATGAVALATVQITSATWGAGAWCFVLGQLSMSVVVVLGLWPSAAWRPHSWFRWRAARDHVRFGVGIWLSMVATIASKNVDNVVVARALGSTALGLYYVAFVLPNIIRQRVTWAAQEVATQTFSMIRRDLERTELAYHASVRCLMGIGCPAMTGIAVLSDPITQVFFGEGWDGTVLPMSIVAVAAVVEFMTMPGASLLDAAGRSFVSARIQGVRLLVLTPTVVLGVLTFGVVGAALAVLTSALLAGLAAQWIVSRTVGIRAGRTIARASRAAFPSLPMGLIVWLLANSVEDAWGAVAALAVSVPAGVLLYIPLLWGLDRKTFRDLRSLAVGAVRARGEKQET